MEVPILLIKCAAVEILRLGFQIIEVLWEKETTQIVCPCPGKRILIMQWRSFSM